MGTDIATSFIQQMRLLGEHIPVVPQHILGKRMRSRMFPQVKDILPFANQ